MHLIACHISDKKGVLHFFHGIIHFRVTNFSPLSYYLINAKLSRCSISIVILSNLKLYILTNLETADIILFMTKQMEM